MFLQDFLRGIIYSCDDEVKVIDSEHSLHLGQGGSGFLSGRGLGRNLPLLQGINLISMVLWMVILKKLLCEIN
jgi:hypothetical protein